MQRQGHHRSRCNTIAGALVVHETGPPLSTPRKASSGRSQSAGPDASYYGGDKRDREEDAAGMGGDGLEKNLRFWRTKKGSKVEIVIEILHV
jgi:hypothetical protein